ANGRPQTANCELVPQRLPGLQRVRDALEGLPLAAQAEERLALEVQQLLFRHGARMRETAAREDPGQLSPDHRVVIADAAGAPGEVDAELERGEQAFSAAPNRGSRLRRRIAGRELQRVRFRAGEQAI